MKPFPVQSATFSVPADIPGRGAASSVTANKDTTLYYMPDQKLLAVIFKPHDRPRFVRFIDHGIHSINPVAETGEAMMAYLETQSSGGKR